MNKIALLEKFINSKLSLKRQRYEKLRFSDHADTKDHYWHLEDYRFESYHPLAPVYITSNPNHHFYHQDFLLCIDSPFDLYFFLQHTDVYSFSPILVLNRSLSPIVPKHWLRKIVYFDISLNTQKEEIERRKLLIHGLINKTSLKKIPLLDDVLDKKYDEQLCYLQGGWDRFTWENHFLFMPKLYSYLSKRDVKYINSKDFSKLSNFIEYDFFDYNPGLMTTTYNYVGDKLLSLGAKPKQLFKREKSLSPLLSVPLSLFHSMNFFNANDIESSYLLDEVDEFKIVTDNDFGQCLVDLCKENFNPAYFY